MVLLSWDNNPVTPGKFIYEFPPRDSEENIEWWADGYGLYLTVTDYLLQDKDIPGWKFPNAIEGLKVNVKEAGEDNILKGIIMPTVEEEIERAKAPKMYGNRASFNLTRLTNRQGQDYPESAIANLYNYNKDISRLITAAWDVITDRSDKLPSIVNDLWILREGESGYFLEDVYSYIRKLRKMAFGSDRIGENIEMEKSRADHWNKEYRRKEIELKEANDKLKIANDFIASSDQSTVVEYLKDNLNQAIQDKEYVMQQLKLQTEELERLKLVFTERDSTTDKVDELTQSLESARYELKIANQKYEDVRSNFSTLEDEFQEYKDSTEDYIQELGNQITDLQKRLDDSIQFGLEAQQAVIDANDRARAYRTQLEGEPSEPGSAQDYEQEDEEGIHDPRNVYIPMSQQDDPFDTIPDPLEVTDYLPQPRYQVKRETHIAPDLSAAELGKRSSRDNDYILDKDKRRRLN